jgi:hypothetical protein
MRLGNIAVGTFGAATLGFFALSVDCLLMCQMGSGGEMPCIVAACTGVHCDGVLATTLLLVCFFFGVLTEWVLFRFSRR